MLLKRWAVYELADLPFVLVSVAYALRQQHAMSSRFPFRLLFRRTDASDTSAASAENDTG
jgi:hypothetical protein